MCWTPADIDPDTVSITSNEFQCNVRLPYKDNNKVGLSIPCQRAKAEKRVVTLCRCVCTSPLRFSSYYEGQSVGAWSCLDEFAVGQRIFQEKMAHSLLYFLQILTYTMPAIMVYYSGLDLMILFIQVSCQRTWW